MRNDQESNIQYSIYELDKYITNPHQGLPEEIFQYITTLTPIINVDLLIRNTEGAVLMSWRDDLCGTGWHIPGGIIRYKERFEERILATARQELHSEVMFDPVPAAINEIILPQKIRGHFVSLLYQCYLPEDYCIDNGSLKSMDAGYLAWIDSCPNAFVLGQRDVYSDLWK